VPGQAKGVWNLIEEDLKESGVTDITGKYGPRLVEQERCAYIRPTIAHCKSPECAIAKKEYMFPFATVVECPQDQMLAKIGPTLVGTVITNDEKLIRAASDCTHIDRLNIGPIPTIKLDWLQPHEGNIIDFLFRNRAYQVTEERLATA
jgi:acyl-CoA reductase-like NAD-dependent aldehyde dehydrogenase